MKRWESEWPVLHLVPMETTSKGRHYFFERTPLCDELALTDGPLNKQADFKSITGTGTAGMIVKHTGIRLRSEIMYDILKIRKFVASVFCASVSKVCNHISHLNSSAISLHIPGVNGECRNEALT